METWVIPATLYNNGLKGNINTYLLITKYFKNVEIYL